MPSPLAFPREIGCGLAGGVWSRYEAMIQELASAHPNFEVLIVRWTGGSTSEKDEEPCEKTIIENEGEMCDDVVSLDEAVDHYQAVRNRGLLAFHDEYECQSNGSQFSQTVSDGGSIFGVSQSSSGEDIILYASRVPTFPNSEKCKSGS